MSTGKWVLAGAITAAVLAVVAAVNFTPFITHGVNLLGQLMHGNTFLQTMAGAYVAANCMAFMRSASTLVWNAVTACFVTTVVVHSSDVVLFDSVKRFCAKRAGKMVSGRSIANVQAPAVLTWEERFRAMVEGLATKRVSYVLKVVPQTETVSLPFTFEGVWVWLFTQDAFFHLKVLGRNREEFLKRVLQHIVDSESDSRPSTQVSNAVVYIASAVGGTGSAGVGAGHPIPKGWGWSRVHDLPPRNKSCLVLHGDQMDMLLKDAKTFFLSAELYRKRQKAFRRGWLLYGPPGTGKSTTGMVVATELDLPVYVLELGNPALDDSSLHALMVSVPVPAIILLEDVDAACSAVKSRNVVNDKQPFMWMGGQPQGLTLGGLLNALDGVHAHEGHLVLMTTNKRETLDEALTRESRCDLQVHLNYASTMQIQGLYKSYFPDATPEQVVRMGTLIDDNRYSPAKISAFLSQYPDAQSAVQSAHTVFVCCTRVRLPETHRDANLYNVLWSDGLEFLFADLLYSSRGMQGSKGLTVFNRISSIVNNCLTRDISRRTVYTTGDCQASNGLPVTFREAVAVFASVFNRGVTLIDEVNQFANKVTQFNAAHAGDGYCISMPRLVHYTLMNSDSTARAISDMDAWLLKHDRPRNANVCRVYTVWFVLRFYDFSPADARRVIEEMIEEGLSTAQDLRSFMWQKKTAPVCFTLFNRFMHTEANSNQYGIITRLDVGYLLEDAFMCDKAVAFSYARELCDVDGRCWWLSHANLVRIVGSPESVDVHSAIGALRAHITEVQTVKDEDVFAEVKADLEKKKRRERRREDEGEKEGEGSDADENVPENASVAGSVC